MGYRLLYSNQLQFLLYAATPQQNLCTNLQRGIRFHQAAGGQSTKNIAVEIYGIKECLIFKK